ncbi:MAG: NFACT RNA binding domain-containing protein, partial [Candidatus Diapherotrites archaeon]|nr:NFACT RNA binding domain-containing protein [Candidatus Diapherotrites archaeon]
MTEIELDLKKSIQEQANEYFDRAKKAKKKLVGLERAITDQQKKLLAHVQKKTEEKKEIIKKRKKEWFEKFHWFYSSDGLLVIGGRDAQSNESIVKKYMDEKDLYFHADVFGAPHCIIKTVEKNSAPEKTLQEAAIFAAAFSKAWQQKQLTATVYSVLPEQVSKKAPAGESLGQGAFMIYGERNWFKNTALE